jgi:transcriptional regulator with XRE-family HTH domain
MPPATLFGRRLREARERLGMPQDKLGVNIGLDEESSSARISRYETGVHEPPFSIAASLAFVLGVPVAYFYCDDDRLADLLVRYSTLSEQAKESVFSFVAALASSA